VLKILIRNIFRTTPRRMLLLSGLLFFSSFLNAQEEQKKAPGSGDTTTTAEETTVDYQSGPDANFRNIWDTLIIQRRSLPAAVVKQLKGDKDFWYADADIKKNKSKEQVEYENENGQKSIKSKEEQGINEKRSNSSYVPLGQRSWFQTLLWIVIVLAFAAVLFMYLSGSNIGLFRRKNVKISGTQDEEVITEDIFAINYQKEIDKAAAQGNYRLAVRLMFLRILKSMAEKNIIRYKQDKTNLDYLLELHPTNYYQLFFRITRNYEYTWYGKFPLSEEAYKVIRSDFDQFEKELH